MAKELEKYLTKSITPVDEYVCTLSTELKKIAADELRENDKIRTHCIKAIRDWVMENPRIIKCRLDSNFMVKVLRFRKYSIPLTQEAIERYLLFREGLYNYDFASNIDILKPHVLDALEQGWMTVLPKRDENGRLTVFIKLSAVDTSIPNCGNVLLSLCTMTLETLSDNEENQIRGVNYIFDLTGAHLRQLLTFPIDMWYKIGKFSEKSCLIRHKSFHVINVHPSLMYVVKFLLGHMPKKLRDRVKLYSTNVAEAGCVALDNLPLEYGGKIPLKAITDEWKQIFMDKREYFLNYSNCKINHALYPKNFLNCSVDSLKVPVSQLDFNDNKPKAAKNEEFIGSFRKLEID